MKIGYVRVSTVEQNEARQLETMKKYKVDKIFSEKVSAKDTNRPKLNDLIKFIDTVQEVDKQMNRNSDISVVIHDFSRLARSTKDLLELVELFDSKKVNLVSAKENIDSSTPSGKLMLTMIGAINEFERTNMLERQREGILIAKSNGKYKGRKAIQFPYNWNEVYEYYKSGLINAIKAMELLGLKKTTFYKLAKQHEFNKTQVDK